MSNILFVDEHELLKAMQEDWRLVLNGELSHREWIQRWAPIPSNDEEGNQDG